MSQYHTDSSHFDVRIRGRIKEITLPLVEELFFCYHAELGEDDSQYTITHVGT